MILLQKLLKRTILPSLSSPFSKFHLSKILKKKKKVRHRFSIRKRTEETHDILSCDERSECNLLLSSIYIYIYRLSFHDKKRSISERVSLDGGRRAAPPRFLYPTSVSRRNSYDRLSRLDPVVPGFLRNLSPLPRHLFPPLSSPLRGVARGREKGKRKKKRAPRENKMAVVTLVVETDQTFHRRGIPSSPFPPTIRPPRD